MGTARGAVPAGAQTRGPPGSGLRGPASPRPPEHSRSAALPGRTRSAARRALGVAPPRARRERRDAVVRPRRGRVRASRPQVGPQGAAVRVQRLVRDGLVRTLDTVGEGRKGNELVEGAPRHGAQGVRERPETGWGGEHVFAKLRRPADGCSARPAAGADLALARGLMRGRLQRILRVSRPAPVRRPVRRPVRVRSGCGGVSSRPRRPVRPPRPRWRTTVASRRPRRPRPPPRCRRRSR